MCDTSDHAMGAVFGQRVAKKLYANYCTSKVLDPLQTNYMTTRKEMLTVVYTFENSRQYLVG